MKMAKIKIPKEINESLCPNCIGKVYSFKFGIYFCPECKGIWKNGVFKKSKKVWFRGERVGQCEDRKVVATLPVRGKRQAISETVGRSDSLSDQKNFK